MSIWIHGVLRKNCPYSELSWSAFFPHFPAFGLNTKRYGVSLRIQSECGKMQKKRWTRITPNTDSFYACRNLKVFSKSEYKVDTSYNWHGNTSKLSCQNICVKQVRKDTQHTSLGNTAQKMNFSFKVFSVEKSLMEKW